MIGEIKGHIACLRQALNYVESGVEFCDKAELEHIHNTISDMAVSAIKLEIQPKVVVGFKKYGCYFTVDHDTVLLHAAMNSDGSPEMDEEYKRINWGEVSDPGGGSIQEGREILKEINRIFGTGYEMSDFGYPDDNDDETAREIHKAYAQGVFTSKERDARLTDLGFPPGPKAEIIDGRNAETGIREEDNG